MRSSYHKKSSWGKSTITRTIHLRRTSHSYPVAAVKMFALINVAVLHTAHRTHLLVFRFRCPSNTYVCLRASKENFLTSLIDLSQTLTVSRTNIVVLAYNNKIRLLSTITFYSSVRKLQRIWVLGRKKKIIQSHHSIFS